MPIWTLYLHLKSTQPDLSINLYRHYNTSDLPFYQPLWTNPKLYPIYHKKYSSKPPKSLISSGSSSSPSAITNIIILQLHNMVMGAIKVMPKDRKHKNSLSTVSINPQHSFRNSYQLIPSSLCTAKFKKIPHDHSLISTFMQKPSSLQFLPLFTIQLQWYLCTYLQ
jgi:hypothetical protein